MSDHADPRRRSFARPAASASGKSAVRPRSVVQPGRSERQAALPRLLGVSCLGGAVLYFSLVHLSGWRTGTVIGSVMLIGPLIEAVAPGFVGKLQDGAEQAQAMVHKAAMLVLVGAVAVFAWLWMTKPPRPAMPTARAAAFDPHGKSRAPAASAAGSAERARRDGAWTFEHRSSRMGERR